MLSYTFVLALTIANHATVNVMQEETSIKTVMVHDNLLPLIVLHRILAEQGETIASQKKLIIF